jgi:hypothetical protein
VVNISIALDDLLQAIRELSAEQKRILRQALEAEEQAEPTPLPGKWIMGLHPGAWTSEDFDEPLLILDDIELK